MLKTMLLISAAALSVPSLAQTTTPAPTEDAMTQPSPVTEDPMTPAPTPETTAPETTPMPESTPPAGDTSMTETAPATEPAPASAAATPAQIAQIVDKEFPSYDADSSAELNEAEFASWMTKLRTQTDPTVDPASEEVKTWIGQAFAAADADKSQGVSKTELTSFLSRSA